jgi:hypothetical protein|tara:strand:- start:1325 stop:2509 length:1185 start_codon:yes stop_codon:yes gene_type:complete
MFLVKNFVAYRCLPASYEVFNYSPDPETPDEVLHYYPVNGLHGIPLIPEPIVEQYKGTHKLVNCSFVNEAGIGRIPCDIGKNGLFHLILPEGKIIDQLILSKSEIDSNIYFSEKSLLYSFYNPTEVERLFLDIKIADDERKIYQTIKSNPKDITFPSNEKDRILNFSKQKKTQKKNDQFAFYQEGDRWFFMYDGKEARNINHMDGFVYINTLLNNPNTPFTAWNLQCGLKGTIPETRNSAQDELNENINSMSITEDFRNDPLYDERYAGHTKKTLKNIDDNIDDLRAEKNIAMSEEGMYEEDEFIVNIDNKIETLIKSKSIYQNNDEKNKSREQARQSVQKAISRTAKKIRSVLPELADYLSLEPKFKPSQMIQTGHTCEYKVAPGQEKEWRLS